jgi:hypothetical protein
MRGIVAHTVALAARQVCHIDLTASNSLIKALIINSLCNNLIGMVNAIISETSNQGDI